MVLGSPGSGKTFFCHALAAAGGPPVYHLDDLYWGPGWTRPTDAEWVRRVTALAALPGWVIDGNFVATVGIRVRAAELVVLFDRHPLLCAWALVRRSIRAWRGTGGEYAPSGLAPGDPAVLSLKALLRKALGFRRKEVQAMRPLFEPDRTHVVRTRRQAARLLAGLAARSGGTAAGNGDAEAVPCRCPGTVSRPRTKTTAKGGAER